MIINIYSVLYILLGLVSYIRGTTIPPNSSSSPPTTPSLEQLMDDCQQETGANPKDIKLVKIGRMKYSNPTLKNWTLCYLVRTGVMSSDGVLRQHVVLENIPDEDKDTVEKSINKCLYQTRHDPADTAWNYLSCFKKMNQSMPERLIGFKQILKILNNE